MVIPFSYAYYVIDLDAYAFGCNPGCFNIDHFSLFSTPSLCLCFQVRLFSELVTAGEN